MNEKTVENSYDNGMPCGFKQFISFICNEEYYQYPWYINIPRMIFSFILIVIFIFIIFCILFICGHVLFNIVKHIYNYASVLPEETLKNLIVLFISSTVGVSFTASLIVLISYFKKHVYIDYSKKIDNKAEDASI